MGIRNKTRNNVLLIMICTLISKFLGLIREMILASKFGTGIISDSYIVSLSIQEVIFTSLSSAILINYIPVFAKIKNAEKEKKFNGILITSLIVIITLLIIVILIFKNQILKIFVVGYTNEQLEYLGKMVSVSIFSVYFLLIGYVFKGFLEYKEKFFCTAVNGILLNVGLIGGILLGNNDHFTYLSFGVLFGYFLNFIIMLYFSIKNGFKAKITFDFKNEELKKVIVLTIPLIFNDAVWEINTLIDKSITSSLGTGYISALNYGNFIVSCIITIFVNSVLNVYFPKLVKNSDDEDYLKNQSSKIFKLLAAICLPTITLLFIYSKDITKILFFRGAFDTKSLEITATAIKLYSLGIIFTAYKTIMFKLYYAKQDTKMPSISATISIVINIALSLILIKYIGYKGVIIATIISSFVSSLFLHELYKKRYVNLIDKNLIRSLLKIIIFNIVFFALTYLTLKISILIFNATYTLYIAFNIVIIVILLVLYMLLLLKLKIISL